MRIAIASGKGGTGKTTVATNLAFTVSALGETAAYIDCDVEEPNGHIFMKPSITESREGTMFYPVVDEEICTSCGECAELCQFKAIMLMGDTPMVFPEMCHACGGCELVCPVDAITNTDRGIGKIDIGNSRGVRFVRGILNVGQVMSPPLIRLVKKEIADEAVTFIDSPPGTSCPVIESIRDSDYVLLVTEPTPFGLHDLKLAFEMLGELSIPFGVFINRSDIGTGDTLKYCEKQSIPIIASLPDDRRIAEAYSNGILVAEAFPDIREVFETCYSTLKRKASG